METVFLALRVLVSLAVVLGLLWVLQRRLTRGGRAQATGDPISVVSRQGISQKASVAVVEAGGRRFLLGVTEQSVNVLHTFEPGRTAGEEDFASILAEATNAIEPGAIEPGDIETISASGTDGRPAVASRTQRRTHLQPVPSSRRTGRRAARPAAGWQQPDPRLGGSILSPGTWKQTAAVLRQGRGG